MVEIGWKCDQLQTVVRHHRTTQPGSRRELTLRLGDEETLSAGFGTPMLRREKHPRYTEKQPQANQMGNVFSLWAPYRCVHRTDGHIDHSGGSVHASQSIQRSKVGHLMRLHIALLNAALVA